MQLEFTKETATLLAGAAVAAVVGVMLGGAMRPQLIFDGRPNGPQMFATGGGPRSTGPFDQGGSYAGYAAGIPSYVVGTDYAQSAYVAAAPIAEEPGEMASSEPEQPATLTRAHYDEPPAPEVAYPSLAGGRSYDAETPEPPPPEDEPPAITG